MKRTILGCCAALTFLPWICGAATIGSGASLGRLPQAWRDDLAHDLALTGFHGHRVVLTMAYAGCHRICPTVIDELKRMQQLCDARGEAVDFVIVGYDPENESPAVWHQYRQTRRLNRDNWHFLTGSVDVTENLAHQLGFTFWKYEEHVMHESRAVLFDAQGVQQAVLGSPTSRWADAL